MTIKEATTESLKPLAIAGVIIMFLLSVIGFFGIRAINSLDALNSSVIKNTEQLINKTEKDSDQDDRLYSVEKDVKEHEKRLTTIEIKR